MIRHNHEPDLTKKYERRAKVAAVLSGIGLPAFFATGEMVTANPASAMPEVAASTETQSPQAFLKHASAYLIKLETQIRGLKNAQIIEASSKSVLGQAVGMFYPNSTLLDISVPSHVAPGKYDLLSLVVDNASGHPMVTALNKGFQERKLTTSPNVGFGVGGGFLIDQSATDSSGNYKYSANNLVFTAGSLKHHQGYQVHTDGPNVEGFAQYAGNEARVTRQFNSFIKESQAIVNANK